MDDSIARMEVHARLRGDEISVSAKHAARIIGMPLRTLQSETKAGKIPAARRLGRRYVYIVEDLRQMILNATRPGVMSNG